MKATTFDSLGRKKNIFGQGMQVVAQLQKYDV